MGPSVAYFWGLQSFDVQPWSWRKPSCQDTCWPARHDCDVLMTKSGSRLLTATPAWKNSSVKCTRRVSSSLQRRTAQTRRNGWTLLWNWNHDGTLELRPKKAELEWAHRSDVPCGRHLVPPFVNYLSLDWTLLRGMVKCRCARLLQMRLTKEALRDALRHEVQVWRRSGYDSRLITQLWSRLWKYPGMEKYVCAYVAGHRPRI